MRALSILSVAVLALAACATVTVVDRGGGTHVISYSEPFAQNKSAQGVIDFRARRVCPRGYEKLSERAVLAEGKDPTYIWTIRCL